MSTVPTLPTVPVFSPPQPDPYFGFGGVQYEIALSSPILQEDTPPPIIIRAHFANSDGIWATEGTDQLYELCKVMSNRPGDFVRQQIFRYGAYCGWLGENREWALPGSTPTSQNGVPILDPVQAWVEDGMRWPPAWRGNLFDTQFLAIQGVAHWIHGKGEPMTVSLADLGLFNQVTDFSPIMNILRDHNNGDGTYQLNEAFFEYNTFDHVTNNVHAAGLIGRVAGTLSGTLTITGGTYVFDGNYGLNPDTYDANPSNRPHYQEALTSFLQAISDAVGTTNYQINFTGRNTVHFQGSRP